MNGDFHFLSDIPGLEPASRLIRVCSRTHLDAITTFPAQIVLEPRLLIRYYKLSVFVQFFGTHAVTEEERVSNIIKRLNTLPPHNGGTENVVSGCHLIVISFCSPASGCSCTNLSPSWTHRPWQPNVQSHSKLHQPSAPLYRPHSHQYLKVFSLHFLLHRYQIGSRPSLSPVTVSETFQPFQSCVFIWVASTFTAPSVTLRVPT
jgi:hypothetical protein